MKGNSNVDDKLRLLQVFLANSKTPGPSIYEVLADSNQNLHCTCPGYKGRGGCKHVKFVQSRIDSNSGTYPLEVSSKATTEDAEKAQRSNKDFRDFVIRYGKIEVF